MLCCCFSGYLCEVLVSQPQPEVRLIERLTSLPSRVSGMPDQFTYGTLGFCVVYPIVYYLTGAPIFDGSGQRVEGKQVSVKGESKGPEHCNLVTYDLTRGQYADHGPIIFEDGSLPSYVNSLAVGDDGWLYCLARFENGSTDLVRIANPHARPRVPPKEPR